jgi:predicted alpha/beta-fold hydrolase
MRPQPTHAPFTPPGLLKNPHVQSVLASIKLRKLLMGKQARWLRWESHLNILTGRNGEKILGRYRQSHWNKKLVILLHGWEGGDDSNYIVSAAVKLVAKGASVMRLNLRDHGDSHYLNRDLFHSARLDEMVDAVAETVHRYPHDETYIIGFSLGGNFALRIAAQNDHAGLGLTKAIAICPPVDPASTMEQLEKGLPLYHHYFTRKWKRSLAKKLHLYPDLGYGDELPRAKSLKALNEFFVPNHTPYATTAEYFNAYALNDTTLNGLKIPAHIIMSKDDPVCPHVDLHKLPDLKHIQVECTDHGGHCGFIEDWKLNSWVDRRLTGLVFGE